MLLITGGNGFVGKHVKANFLANSIEYLSPSSIQLDLTNREAVFDYFYAYKPTAILHMASKCAGIGGNSDAPADFIHVNSKMHINLFDAVKEFGVEYFYGLGTICAYPKNCPVPFNESDLWNGYPEETNAPYGFSKKLLLELQSAYRKQYGLKGCHLLTANLYGPHDNFNLRTSHVIPALIRKIDEAIENNDVEVECWGTGTASRDFLYVKDLAKLLVNIYTNKIDIDGPINVGTGTSIKISQLVLKIADILSYKGIHRFNGSLDGQMNRELDITKARNLLGFNPETDLNTGLIETIQWYKESKLW